MEFQTAHLKHPSRRVVQFDGTTEMAQEIADWIGTKSFGMTAYVTIPVEGEDFEPYVTIPTMEGMRTVRKDNWILEICAEDVPIENAQYRAYRDEDFRLIYALEEVP